MFGNIWSIKNKYSGVAWTRSLTFNVNEFNTIFKWITNSQLIPSNSGQLRATPGNSASLYIYIFHILVVLFVDSSQRWSFINFSQSRNRAFTTCASSYDLWTRPRDDHVTTPHVYPLYQPVVSFFTNNKFTFLFYKDNVII